MAGKTGGNKKVSSPSAQNYWKRAEAAKYSETHRAKRIARHKKRAEKKAGRNLPASDSTPPLPKLTVPRPVERVAFTGNVPDHRVWLRDNDGHKFIAAMPVLTICPKTRVTLNVEAARRAPAARVAYA
jgi:hypothetical protein